MFSSHNAYWFIVVVVVVVGWFALGTQYNVRKGHQALAWLQQGLKVLGEKTSLRWLGSAVLELKLQNAKEPFRTAEVLVVLEPRDVGVFWWYHHARGRRDLLIVRGQLPHPPPFEFEALDPRGWSTRGIEHRLQFRNWNPLPLSSSTGLVAYYAGSTLPPSELLAVASNTRCPLIRLAIHRTEPHLELHWKLADARKLPAQELLETARRIPGLLQPHH